MILKKALCLFVFVFFSALVYSVPSKFIKFKYQDKYGILNENFDVVCENLYSGIYFINNYIFLNSGEYIEIRDSNNNILDKVKSENSGFFTSVNYLIDDFYVFHGFSKDLVYNIKSKKLFYSDKIAINAFEEKTSNLLPIYTKGIYKSLRNNKISDITVFEKVYPFVGGLAVVLKKDWTKAVIDEKGRIIVDNIINCGWQFKNGLLPVITEHNSGFIDRKGNFVFKCSIVDEYKKQNPGGNPTLWCMFSENLAYIHTSETSHILIDKNWNIIKKDILYNTDSRHGFSNGFLLVNYEGKYGFLNSKGELKIPLIFDYAEDFQNGYACALLNGEDCLVDKNGKTYPVKTLLCGRQNGRECSYNKSQIFGNSLSCK